jgi:hypothetical protein
VYNYLYEFEELDIMDRLFLVIIVKDKSLGPKDFKKHEKTLRKIIDYPQLWHLKELHFNKIQRMIENEFNFIVEDKQVHLPSVSISIRPRNESVTVKTQLTGLSVNMLIREILKGDLSGKSKVEIAELFKTTKMTAGRAIGPLIANDLCQESKIGVAKNVQFKKRAQLWDYLKKNIKSPIKEVFFTDASVTGLAGSGIYALSKKSMLAEDEIKTFACEKKVFKKKFTKIKPVLEEFAKCKIELWDRAAILLEDNCINIIDIFLTNKDIEDERVQIELESLVNGIEND